jgi:hypothetical protein
MDCGPSFSLLFVVVDVVLVPLVTLSLSQASPLRRLMLKSNFFEIYHFFCFQKYTISKYQFNSNFTLLTNLGELDDRFLATGATSNLRVAFDVPQALNLTIHPDFLKLPKFKV